MTPRLVNIAKTLVSPTSTLVFRRPFARTMKLNYMPQPCTCFQLA
jgi:hypothetical protein